MRDLNDEYNAMNPSDAVDGYEYPRLDNSTTPNNRHDDLTLAVFLLASHIKNLYRKVGVHDDEISIEIDAVLKRMRRG